MAKRGQNEGSIYKRGDGRWVGVINLGWRNGKRHRKSFYGDTRRDVQQQLTTALRNQQLGLNVAPERQTVAQFLERWLEDCARCSVRPTTFRRYRDIVRLHIAPELGRIPLAKLTPQHVQQFLNRKHGGAAASRSGIGRPAPDGLSARTVQHINAVLRVALGQALRWDLVPRNVAALVALPRKSREEVRPFSPEEARRFLDAVKGHRLEALFTAALALGLRLGEALGLRWEDVDFDSGTLSVRHGLQRIDGRLALVEPKTERSRRRLVLPRIVVKVLRAHKVRQIEERVLVGPRWQEGGFVFATTIGTPLDARNVQERFKRVLRDAELRPQRFHDLRHGAASLLLAQGVSARGVMEILGHSQIGITLNLYSHVMPELLHDAADQMDAVLAGR